MQNNRFSAPYKRLTINAFCGKFPVNSCPFQVRIELCCHLSHSLRSSSQTQFRNYVQNYRPLFAAFFTWLFSRVHEMTPRFAPECHIYFTLQNVQAGHTTLFLSRISSSMRKPRKNCTVDSPIQLKYSHPLLPTT